MHVSNSSLTVAFFAQTAIASHNLTYFHPLRAESTDIMQSSGINVLSLLYHLARRFTSRAEGRKI